MNRSFLTPHPIHPKIDVAAQEAFKKNFADHLAAIAKTTLRRALWRPASGTKPSSARAAS